MKKTKSCIALICAVVMLMTAFVVVPVTANAEDGNICYATLTNTKNNVTTLSSNGGYGKITCESNGSVRITAKVYPNREKNQKCEHAMFITLTKNSDDMHSWKMTEKTYGNVTDKVTHKTSYGVVTEVTTKSPDGEDSKFDLQKVFEMNCDYSNKKPTTLTKVNVNRYLTVDFDVANYAVTNNFRLYSNTDINKNVKVSNKKPVFYKTNNSPVFINFDDRNSTTKEYDGSSNIIIKDMSVNCSNNNKYYGNGFMYAAHAENLTVCNIEVTNSLYNGHAFQITGMNNVVIENSTFKDCLYYAIKDDDEIIIDYGKYNRKDLKQYHEIDNGKYGNNLSKSEKKICQKLFSNEIIQIEPDYKETDNDQVFALPTIKMSNDDTVSKNVFIVDCTFSNVMRAIGNHSNRGGRCHTIKIYHNNINNTVGHSIVLSKNKDVYIVANTFDNISIDNIGGYPIYGVKNLVENQWQSPFVESTGDIELNNNFVNVKSGRKTKEVNLWELASNVKLSKTSINLSLNKSYTLKATVLPALASDKRVKWATSSSKIATVSQNGKVTGKKKGNCIITATSLENNKLVAKCTVTVK